MDRLIEEITNGFDTDGHVDYIGMTEGINQITRISELLLGVMVTILIFGISLVVAIELIYINMPIFRVKAEERLNEDGKLVGLVLHDAILAVREANTIQTGKTVNAIYLRIKLKYIISAVVLITIVLLGWGPLVGILVKIMDSIITGFQSVV